MDHPDVDARAIEEGLLALRAIELEDQARELVATLAPADPTYPRQATAVLRELAMLHATLIEGVRISGVPASPLPVSLALAHIAAMHTQAQAELREHLSRAAGWWRDASSIEEDP